MPLSRKQNMRRAQHGVTLVELMIAVAIVGILAAVAYPSYRNQVIRSTRTEGKVALEQRALAMEKCFTRYMSYIHPNCAAFSAPPTNTVDGHYRIDIDAGATATAFRLTATPLGAQATDAECGTFRLDQAGNRTITGNGRQERCW
jgi:type IV pilus assembly protein PilE